MKKKIDETTIRILEILHCGECFYFDQDCRLRDSNSCCEETGKPVKFDDIPPDSCPLHTVKEFVEMNYKCIIKKQEK